MMCSHFESLSRDFVCVRSKQKRRQGFLSLTGTVIDLDLLMLLYLLRGIVTVSQYTLSNSKVHAFPQ